MGNGCNQIRGPQALRPGSKRSARGNLPRCLQDQLRPLAGNCTCDSLSIEGDRRAEPGMGIIIEQTLHARAFSPGKNASFFRMRRSIITGGLSIDASDFLPKAAPSPVQFNIRRIYRVAMSPVTHFLTGWIAANASTNLDHRSRILVTLAAVAPDLDGLGMVPELLTAGSNNPVLWYSSYHHVLCHNLTFGLLLGLGAWLIGARRRITGLLALMSFHLHLVCDVVGSRGPDGYQWPIYYLYPFSSSCTVTWNGQWELNAWPNYVITLLALLGVLALSLGRGYSPLGIVSAKADQVFVATLRRRWPLNHREGGELSGP